MTTTINADTVVGGAIVTGDASGVLALQSSGVTAITLGTDQTATYAAAAYEKYSALSGTTPSVDCRLGNFFALTTSGNTTFTFSNVPASGAGMGFTLKLTAGGTHTLTWPASVDWAGGTAPDAPASGETNIYVFITHDGGTTWYGFLGGAALA